MTEWLLLLAAILLTGGTAVFVAAEFSLVALDRPTVQKAIDAGDGRARVVLQSLRQLSTSCPRPRWASSRRLVVGYLAQPSIGRLLAGPLGNIGLAQPAVEAISGASPSCWRPPSRWSSASCSHSSSASRRP